MDGYGARNVNSNITQERKRADERRRRSTNWQFSARHGNVPSSWRPATLARPTCACTYARTATGRGDHAEQEARPCVACARAAPLAPPLRRGSLRRECGTQLKLLGFSSPRGESKFSFNVSKKKKRELELELELMVVGDWLRFFCKFKF